MNTKKNVHYNDLGTMSSHQAPKYRKCTILDHRNSTLSFKYSTHDNYH